MNSLVADRRTTPARPDLAAAFLAGQVQADRFVTGERRMVRQPVAGLRREPRADAPLDTEALRGEAVTVFDVAEGWAWVQLERDGYVGYLPDDALGAPEDPDARVHALRTFVFPGADMKLPVVTALPFGACCRLGRTVGGFAEIDGGFVWSGHMRSLTMTEPDFVAVAERLIGVPYLWGGRSSFGVDCSGLVQTALAAAGVAAPRDSDMQAAMLGEPLDAAASLQRGDLVFWPGHVGIMRSPEDLLHANAHTMMVSTEPLAQAKDRIAATTGRDDLAVRRLVGLSASMS